MTYLNAEVEQISTRFQDNIEQSPHELSDEGSINRENSSTRYALFVVINRLPEDASLPADLQAKRLKISIFLLLCIALFALIGFNYTDFFNKETRQINEETPQTVVKPLTLKSEIATSTPVVAQAAPEQTPQIVTDSVLKVDTLLKKKNRRFKKKTGIVARDSLKVN